MRWTCECAGTAYKGFLDGVYVRDGIEELDFHISKDPSVEYLVGLHHITGQWLASTQERPSYFERMANYFYVGTDWMKQKYLL